jgi:hypothetical protein
MRGLRLGGPEFVVAFGLGSEGVIFAKPWQRAARSRADEK